MPISPALRRAVRALTEMDQVKLARRAVARRYVIADFEDGSLTPSASNLVAVRAALEATGVIFLDENGGG
jgi:hypothetical protein